MCRQCVSITHRFCCCFVCVSEWVCVIFEYIICSKHVKYCHDVCRLLRIFSMANIWSNLVVVSMDVCVWLRLIWDRLRIKFQKPILVYWQNFRNIAQKILKLKQIHFFNTAEFHESIKIWMNKQAKDSSHFQMKMISNEKYFI